MNVTLKDIPEKLHTRLREKTNESGRSLNKLIIYTLEQAYSPSKIDRQHLLKKIQTERNAMDIWIDDKSLQEAKENGRNKLLSNTQIAHRPE